VDKADEVAADYIAGLWGTKRRIFARQYWLFLTRGMERPLLTDCFGAPRIEDKLNSIERRYSSYSLGEKL